MPCLRSLLLSLAMLAAMLSPLANAEVALDRIVLPPGFTIALWARLDNPRQMTLGHHDTTGGVLYVGSMRAGKVYALRYGADFKLRSVVPVATGLNMPVGVAYRDGALYVSAVSRILRYDDIDQHLNARAASPLTPSSVIDTLPTDTHHGWKFIAFGPDGKLYVPVGAPCNICEPDPQRYANILRMNADGSALEVFARGVRNSVGFDWQPKTGELWFTENGRDQLGDEVPPDELNHASKAGLHFGYPYCHGGDLADPQFGKRRNCDEFEPPAQKLDAHVAALGMRFYTGTMFPPTYRNQIFIAEHGSWNRAKKTGYRIALVRVKDGKAVAYESFASGWLDGEKTLGRPADVLVLPDGSLLVADDFAGAIYRITYRA